MTLLRDAFRALRLTAGLWVLTVVIYTLPLLAIGQGLFPFQANGSLLRVNDQVAGSALIGQPFSSERYFRSRPSAVDYSTGKEAPGSGPSNIGPTNPDLGKRIAEEFQALEKAGWIGRPAPDLLYSSGSGMDPHISPLAAEQQIVRVAEARRVPPEKVRQLVRQNSDGRVFGILGEPHVNVLKLNLALDALAPEPARR